MDGSTKSTFTRKPPGHTPPPWINSGALFFITICCEERGDAGLCEPDRAFSILDSVRSYHEQERWFARLFLLMPDHIHALVAFPPDSRMSETLRNWKRFVARESGVKWQRGYFDHRIRDSDNLQMKAAYIRENPVRKGLVMSSEQWPYVFES